MNLRALFFTIVLLGAGWFAPTASAHAPFDSSVRVIAHADFVEVNLSFGSSLGENYLRSAELPRAQLPIGHPFVLNPALATNFFTVAEDGLGLTPHAASGITDGLEYQFHFEYALKPGRQLRLNAQFLPALPPPHVAPLVLTDENGNIFGSAILAPGKETADFALPEKLFPALTNDGLIKVSELTTNELPAGSQQHVAVSVAPSFAEFLKLGIGHILCVDAFDHLLFLLALLLGCQRLKPMLLVITGFTLAHSLTLALAALNLVTLSARVVEPAIAASIIFVATENFRRAEKSWHRYALTAGFGLIHGFGFASALRESGLGGTGLAIVKPLFAFNLGVEIGQLTVAAIVLPLLLALNRWSWFARHGARMISALVILVATFWLWQRLAA